MRIWIGTIGGLTINFQAEDPEEEQKLDEVLGFNHKEQPIPIGNDRDRKIGQGAYAVGELVRHESQRWIRIDLNAAVAYPTQVC